VSRHSRAERPAPELRCPECGSRKIACEREATLVARVAGLRDGTLILDGPAVAQPLDGVYLVCAECAAELPGAEWSAERPRQVPRGEQSMTDADALDALAEKLSEPGDWNGGDVCGLAAELLLRTGRCVSDGPGASAAS
jgi:hypothetical protein